MPEIRPGQLLKLAGGVFVLVLLIWGIGSSFYTVGAESEAVVLRFGAYHATAQPGLHFKLPFGIDEAISVPVRTNSSAEFGFKQISAGQQSRYQKTSKDAEVSEMLTGDLNIADVEWTVQYRIKDAKDYLFNVADVEGTIGDVSESVMRRLVGDRSIDEVITIGRTEMRLQAQEETQKKLDELNCGIQVVNLNLQDVGPPDQVKAAFDDVNKARQEKEGTINKAKAQKKKEVPNARGAAGRQILAAEGYRMQKILEVTGETNALLAQYAEYEKAKRETRIRLYMETMEAVLGQSQRKIFIDEDIKGLLPHLDLSEPKGGAR
jgi:membrane protease subunit HflK